MTTFTDVAALIPTLCGCGADVDDADCARASMMQMADADVVKILEEAAALAHQVEQITVAAAGVIAVRSTRERGHTGLSASRGHRSAASLIQDLTGSTKADANRAVRVGEALLDEPDATDGGVPRVDEARPEGGPAPRTWYQPLRDALRDGRLASAQFDAIKRGLGELPEFTGDARELADDARELADAEARAVAEEEARAAWEHAADQLVGEAAERTVEELWQAARTVRDMLDPAGAEARFLERYAKRSFRTYRGQNGEKRASIVFDDEGDASLETLMAAGLRPRRGGPRFVDSDDKQQAASLVEDPRTTDQLAYDLLMDVLHAGMLADAETVFGTRQAGVRLVQVVDAEGRSAPTVHTEDSLASMPGAVADQRICDSGIVPVTVDACGNPLDVGREQRLFTSKQRIALAMRDGGCRWRGCDRPASYCEAHHIDEWQRDQGRTDIDRGILLCRYHHMSLHHGGWRITRRGTDDFVLERGPGEKTAMRPRAVLRYAFGDIEPPPKRFRPAA